MDNVAAPSTEVLEDASWGARRDAHESRVDGWIQPHLARRRVGAAHPVEDFLFTYYSQRPGALRRWHPGFGFALSGPGAASYLALKGYDGRGDWATVTQTYVASQQPHVTALHRLLQATAGRPARLGCFGMHEWAMVYRLDPADLRHPSWPLRLGSSGTDAVVESQPIACSHYDAFRFFTDEARPLNVLQPGRADRASFEQPGCLHAGMDLYKHAFQLSPMVSSDLVADCFELARDIRVLDMRASPYDLSDLGYPPVAVETADGRQEYAVAQRAFAQRGAPLRQRLIDETARLLATTA